jgi:DNA mismatch repair ATPase MutS
LKRLSRIAAALSLRFGNPYLWAPLQLIVPWDFLFSYELSRCKASITRLIPIWVDVWTELEALVSLANLAWLHPEYRIPDFRTSGPGGFFTARDLGHPLIPCDRKVVNDFELGADKSIAIITGSNMAGKSTFLRTLGINLVLAYAGGPVSASRFAASYFRIFACIKVSDSLADGLSYFYAEVKRLKAILDSVKSNPVSVHFVLIDEIFRGTNNRERRIGSQSYIRALAELPVTAAVATHDLELIRLEQEIPAVTNYHFREDVVDGRMVFDYRIHRGPCPTTNALRIMEIEGLPVNVAKEA